LKIAIVTGVRRNFSVALICISLMVRDIEQFFMYLLAISTSSLECSLFNSCWVDDSLGVEFVEFCADSGH
jgi:hypothetical protein